MGDVHDDATPNLMVEPSDAELLVLVVDRDIGALRELHDRHVPWLIARLHRRCGDPDVVAEVVQDTFLAVWRGAGRYDGSGEVAAWIWGIGIRQLIGRLRRRSAPTPVTDDVLVALARATGHEALQRSAEDAVLVGLEHGDLHGALTALSPELRLVVQATVLDGLSTREAAQLLGIPRGTVKTRMRRARSTTTSRTGPTRQQRRRSRRTSRRVRSAEGASPGERTRRCSRPRGRRSSDVSTPTSPVPSHA